MKYLNVSLNVVGNIQDKATKLKALLRLWLKKYGTKAAYVFMQN